MWLCVIVCEFLKFPCVCSMLRTLSFESSSVFWSVKTLRFFKVPLCVNVVVCCVRTLSVHSSPVCGLCVLACEDFDFSKFPCV